MREPFAYLAYAPRGPGLLYAVLLFAVEKDVYGWYARPQGATIAAGFFMLEDFYSRDDTVLYRSVQDDVYDGWVIMKPAGEIGVDRPVPVPEELRHELEHEQSVFMREWLFYADDATSREEMEIYRRKELPLRAVNIKHGKLNKLEQHDAVWTYATPGMDLNVIGFLKEHGLLENNGA